MSQQTIRCPQCDCEIQLDEALSTQIRQQLDGELRQAYAAKLAEERKKILDLSQRQAQDKVDLKLKALQEEVDDKKARLELAQKNELELLKKQRDVEEKARALDLELARRLEEERKKIVEEVQQANADQFELRLADREKTIKDMAAQIELLKKKAEQGSQQQQGEVLELKLEEMLRGAFPYDIIEPVGKGKKGGDVTHQIRGHSGQSCGTILWEAKHAKSWKNDWVDKLKQDMADAKAEIGIIVTTALPAGFERFGDYDGIWVTDIRSVTGLATALRAGLIEVENTRQASVCKNEKMELLSRYLHGQQFRQRIQGYLDLCDEMQYNLDKERKTMEKLWAKREKEIERAIMGISGMYGDMQGILGMSMPELESEELKALAPAENSEKSDE